MALIKHLRVGEEELLNIQAQQVASNLLLWVVFMRLYKFKQPMMKILLVNTIYNKHMLQYSRKTLLNKLFLLFLWAGKVSETPKGVSDGFNPLFTRRRMAYTIISQYRPFQSTKIFSKINFAIPIKITKKFK